MEWTLTNESWPRKNRLVVEWDTCDLTRVQLDPWDLALLRECDVSPRLSDKLLALEMLARKVDIDAPCPACGHVHAERLSCEQALREERIQARIDRQEEKDRHEN